MEFDPCVQPLVSIVLTSHNGEKYLVAQLDSLVGQTYQHIEIIISDDASTDGTWNIAQRYADADNRIALIRNETNIGLHANLTVGLLHASGKYIAIADQDDVWLPNKIEKLMASIGDKAGIFTDSILVGADDVYLGGTLLQSSRLKDWDNCNKPLNLLFKNAASGHAMLFRRELLNVVLPFTDHVLFDHHLALCAAIFGGLVFYREPLVWHRIHGENHTNAALGHVLDQKNRMNPRSQRLLRRERLQNRLQVFQKVRSEDIDIFTKKGFSVDKKILAKLIVIAETMEKTGNKYFSVKLMLQLYQLGKIDSYCTQLGLKQCFRLAKGKKWHDVFSWLGFC